HLLQQLRATTRTGHSQSDPFGFCRPPRHPPLAALSLPQVECFVVPQPAIAAFDAFGGKPVVEALVKRPHLTAPVREPGRRRGPCPAAPARTASATRNTLRSPPARRGKPLAASPSSLPKDPCCPGRAGRCRTTRRSDRRKA